MPTLGIILDVEHEGFTAMRGMPYADADEAVAAGALIHLDGESELEVGALAHGMESGNPSVAFCFKLPDGRIVLAETSMKLLLTAAETLATIYGDPR